MICGYQRRDRCGDWMCGTRDGRCVYPGDDRYQCEMKKKREEK